MKITKTPEQAYQEKLNKEFILQAAKICPFCGTVSNIMFNPIKTVEIKTGWLKTTLKTVMYFKCGNCGAEWESDPY